MTLRHPLVLVFGSCNGHLHLRQLDIRCNCTVDRAAGNTGHGNRRQIKSSTTLHAKQLNILCFVVLTNHSPLLELVLADVTKTRRREP